jgi:transcriptional regulator with XRE-family HTH domain
VPADDPDLLRVRRQIGARIRALRLRRDLTQEELAEALAVDRKTISRAENGVHPYDVDFVIRLARALRCPLYWLFTDDWPIETGQLGAEHDLGT